MIRFAAIALLFLASCASPPQGPIRNLATGDVLQWPEMKAFAAGQVTAPTRPNSEIAQDFLDLAFEMENGRTLPVLTRFEEPITVRVTGETNPVMLNDLRVLLTRIRQEARIDISLVSADQANITIEAVSRNALRRVAPNAACFVVPRVATWRELRRARGTPTVDWATLTIRDRVAIFIPSDVAPQETRDCLHEELAQALGPLNDLYRLPDSVFNDDNIHAVLTGFDMLILRAFYAPELRSGMTRAQVAARLPRILNRLNPAGQRAGGQIPSSTSREWIKTMEIALTPGSSDIRRRNAAERAIGIARQHGWTGTREGFAHYAYGRLQIGNDNELALAAFNNASRAYRQSAATRLHAAHVSVQQLAFTLSAGDYDRTVAIADRTIPIATAGQNAALLSLVMMFKAEALERQGKSDSALALRVDSLAWARYGFGDRRTVLSRLNEIASLRARQAKGDQ